MDTELKYTEHDLKLFGELEGIKVLLGNVHDKIGRYCTDNDKQHDAMWKKLDIHSKRINWIMGLGAGISAVFAVIWHWITTKVGVK